MRATLFAALALVLAGGQTSPTRSSPLSPWVLDHAALAANSPSQKFEFRAGAWVSLHHFLYVLGRARNDTPDSHRDAVVKAPADVEGLSARSVEERAAWDEALRFYADGLSKKDAVFDRDLVKVTAALASAETRSDLSGLGLDPPLVATLERVMPIYRAVWWPRHSDANTARQRELQAQLDAHGDAAVQRLTALYGMTWPDRPRIIDLVAYATWAGAYSTDGGLIVASSLDDSQRGPLGLEILLHESSHQWDEAIEGRIARVAAAHGTKPPRDLSHMLIFYTTGEVVRELVPGHVPYAVKYGLWERGGLRGMKPVLDAWWQPYLRGSGTFDDALTAVLAHLIVPQQGHHRLPVSDPDFCSGCKNQDLTPKATRCVTCSV